MCNCFEKTKERLIEKVKADLPECTEFDAKWENSVFFYGENKPSIPVVIPFKYSYRQIKVNGQPYRAKTNDGVNITMTYCPFCGEKS